MAKNIVLTGIMGCGKTAVGKEISSRLGFRFVDVDEYIENTENRTIAQIFESGEEAFRDIEEAAITKLAQESNLVISTGGGAVLRQNNVISLKKNGTIFFINRPIGKIVETVETSHRPLLAKGSDVLYKIFEARYPVYKSTCDFEIINDRSIKYAVDTIIEKYKANVLNNYLT